MKNFVTADLHLGHKGSLKMFRNNGEPLRPFEDLDEMHKQIIGRWNSVVTSADHTFILGDITFGRTWLPLLKFLNGEKTAVLGNHDDAHTSEYLIYFRNVKALVDKKGYIMSHIPIHPDCMDRWHLNVHGHLHSNQITIDGEPDPRYMCVSLEQNDFYSIDMQKVLDRVTQLEELKNANS